MKWIHEIAYFSVRWKTRKLVSSTEPEHRTEELKAMSGVENRKQSDVDVDWLWITEDKKRHW